jgi:DNA-binding CsgD family transcriptional regulator
VGVASSRNSVSKYPKTPGARPSRLGLESRNLPSSENAELRTPLPDMGKAKHKDTEHHSCSHDLIRAGLEALDSVDVGVVVTDESGRLMLANHVAEQILEAHDGIEVTSSGAVVIATESGFRPLRLPTRRTSQPGIRNDQSTGDSVDVIPRGSEKRPMTLLIRSLSPGGAHNPTDPAFLIFLLDPERPTQTTDNGLRELYEFTVTETRLAHLLMAGKTFEECCTQLGVRASTIRMHLGNMFAKTGVRRQGQLVSLLLRSLGMVRTTAVPNFSRKHVIRPASRLGKEQQLDIAAALSASLEALNWLNVGIIVLNRLGEILFTNQRAAKILTEKDGLEATPQGTLSTGQKRWPQSWSSVSRTFSPMDAVIAVPRTNGKRPLTLIVRSLNDTERSGAESPVALVFLLDPELASEATEARLQALYEFTASEARLARLLMEGNTIDECCGPLSICPSTARRHLANIFSKTDVRHQGQLISLLLKSAGTVRAKNDDRLAPSTKASPRTIAMPFPPAHLPRSIRP